MPCDSVAIAKATLSASVQDEILGKPSVVLAFKNWLAQTYQGSVTEYYSTTDSLGLALIDPKDAAKCFVLTIDCFTGTPRVQVRPSARTGEKYAADILPTLQTFLSKLAQYAARERMIGTVKKKFRVTNDVLMPTAAGPARVLTLEV